MHYYTRNEYRVSSVAYYEARHMFRYTAFMLQASRLDMLVHSVPPFSFLSNHGLVLLCIAHDPRARMRDVAAAVDITERAAQRIVAELIDYGYVTRAREGRRNRYTVRVDLPLTLPTPRDVDLGSLLNVLVPADSSDERRVRVSGAA
jgi:DNA-binding MarR family transcriptional regulator